MVYSLLLLYLSRLGTAISQLRDELKQSVQQRINKNIELGSDKAHAQRQAAEQQLIDSIDKFLGH